MTYYLSYAKPDRDVAAALAERLGGSAWLGPEAGSGVDRTTLIADALDASPAMIMLWTPAAQRSRLIHLELGAAIAKIDDRRSPFSLFPVLARSASFEDLHPNLKSLGVIDASSAIDAEDIADQIVAKLEPIAAE